MTDRTLTIGLGGRGKSAGLFARFSFPCLLVCSLVLVASVLFYWVPDEPSGDGMGNPTSHDFIRAGLGVILLALLAVAGRCAVARKSPQATVLESTDARWDSSMMPDRLQAHVQWFIAMRWIAVLVSGVLVVFSVQTFRWLPEQTFFPLLGTIGLLAFSNLVYQFLLWRGQGVFRMLVCQGYVDLVLFTVMLHFSGGVENFLAVLMVLHVIISGVLLSRFHCYGIGVVGAVLYAAMAGAQLAEIFPHYSLDFVQRDALSGQFVHDAKQPVYVLGRVLLQAVLLFLTAHFVTSLADRIRENERRLEAMAERAESERQLLERSLETTGAGLRLIDESLETTWCNTRWRDWFNGSAGTPDRTNKYDRQSNTVARKVLSDGQPRVFELICGENSPEQEGGAASDRRRIFQITSAPLHNGHGKVGQVVELAQEVTEQKAAQARLVRASKLAAVGELAGAVAHEVNNPIAIISAKTSLLLEDHREEMSPGVAQEVAKLNHQANRVARIAQSLLSYCRPSGATRLEIDLRQPIRKALALIEWPARQRNVKLEDRLGESLPPVKANGSEMEQVFLNLFLNALDAMPTGGRLVVRPAASATLPAGEHCLAITVEDTGTGIPEEIRERVFEPFFTTKQEGRGTGLGLCICQGLVRGHGGELRLESAGEGTRVTVSLPIASAHHQKLSLGDEYGKTEDSGSG